MGHQLASTVPSVVPVPPVLPVEPVEPAEPVVAPALPPPPPQAANAAASTSAVRPIANRLIPTFPSSELLDQRPAGWRSATIFGVMNTSISCLFVLRCLFLNRLPAI